MAVHHVSHHLSFAAQEQVWCAQLQMDPADVAAHMLTMQIIPVYQQCTAPVQQLHHIVNLTNR